MSLQSFKWDAHSLKYNIPLNNTNFVQRSTLSSDNESINSKQNPVENNEVDDNVKKNHQINTKKQNNKMNDNEKEQDQNHRNFFSRNSYDRSKISS